jgi:hypothetical protein
MIIRIIKQIAGHDVPINVIVVHHYAKLIKQILCRFLTVIECVMFPGELLSATGNDISGCIFLCSILQHFVGEMSYSPHASENPIFDQ